MTITIIIPTFNEAQNITTLVHHLRNNGGNSVVEIIVSDGGSQDPTVELAKAAGANVIHSPTAGRAAQMNYAATIAKGDMLYFIHADTLPPQDFVKNIQQAISDGFDLGRYQTQFNSNKKILRVNAWFTRFDLFICMGGDQTLFITRKLFETCGGFNEKLIIMEDYDFCQRARKTGKYKILKGKVLVSARKYSRNSWLKVQLANLKIMRMYKKGASQQDMVDTYKRILNPF